MKKNNSLNKISKTIISKNLNLQQTAQHPQNYPQIFIKSAVMNINCL